MNNPTTYDGIESIAEIHPSILSADIFPKMRALTDDDMFAIAGHILLQPRIVSEKWGEVKFTIKNKNKVIITYYYLIQKINFYNFKSKTRTYI